MFWNKPLILVVILLLLITASLLANVLEAPEAFAQDDYGLREAAGEAGLPHEANIGVLVGKIIRYVIAFLGVVLVIIIITGGFIWMTSGGNQEKVTKAKAMITNGLIGLAIVVFSFVLANFIIERFIEVGKVTPAS